MGNGEKDINLMDELGKLYQAMSSMKDQISNRLGDVEKAIVQIKTTMSQWPQHTRVPCETACDLVRRVALLEFSVSEHHKREDDDNRMRRAAGWKVFTQVVSSAIIAAGSSYLMMKLHRP